MMLNFGAWKIILCSLIPLLIQCFSQPEIHFKENKTWFLNRAEVGRYLHSVVPSLRRYRMLSFPSSVVPAFRCPKNSKKKLFKIKKNPSKMNSPTLLWGRGRVPKKLCDISKKIRCSRLSSPKTFSKSRQAKFQKKNLKIKKLQHIWTPRPQNRGGGVGHFGSGRRSTFTRRGAWVRKLNMV